MITKEKLNELAHRGFIAGPDESEEHFLVRSTMPPEDNPSLKKPLGEIQELFGMCPDWVKVEFTKKGLYPWEGGYFEVGDKSRLVLHPKLEKKGKLMGYHSLEIISHELVHAMREAFDEPIFEEVLSYQTSKSRLRRFLGPLFRSTAETFVFFLFSILSFLLSLLSPIALIGLILFLSFLFIRRIRNEITFSHCKKKAEIIAGDKRKWALLLFLMDEEIKNFAKWDIDQVIEYLKSEETLRHQQLRAFFSE